jgi:hypothetical protein
MSSRSEVEIACVKRLCNSTQAGRTLSYGPSLLTQSVPHVVFCEGHLNAVCSASQHRRGKPDNE